MNGRSLVPASLKIKSSLKFNELWNYVCNIELQCAPIDDNTQPILLLALYLSFIQIN